jgi:hypothetical protein
MALTADQRTQVALLVVTLEAVRGVPCVNAILRPLRRRGWLRFVDMPDVALLAIWAQWGHLLPNKETT